MKIETYLQRHKDIKEFYIQAKDIFAKCNRDSFDDMNNFGHWKIKRIEEPPYPDELITFVVQ